MGLFVGSKGPARREAASEVEGIVEALRGETMIRTKMMAGAVVSGVMLMSAMGCQQAPAPAPTVVVEHQNDGHDRDRDRDRQQQQQAQQQQAQRDQAQRDQDHRNPPPPPPRRPE